MHILIPHGDNKMFKEVIKLLKGAKIAIEVGHWDEVSPEGRWTERWKIPPFMTWKLELLPSTTVISMSPRKLLNLLTFKQTCHNSLYQ